MGTVVTMKKCQLIVEAFDSDRGPFPWRGFRVR